MGSGLRSRCGDQREREFAGHRYDAAPGRLELSFTTLAEHVEEYAVHIPVTFVFVEPGSRKLTAFRVEADFSEPREVGYLQ